MKLMRRIELSTVSKTATLEMILHSQLQNGFSCKVKSSDKANSNHIFIELALFFIERFF